MKILKHLPNFITCCNLACGVLGIFILIEGQKTGLANPFDIEGSDLFIKSILISTCLIGLAAIFDFFDGFAARMLKVSSPIGKDLDSLADLVTFGVLPGVMVYVFIGRYLQYFEIDLQPLAFIAAAIPIFSAIRLAKFNNDDRQTSSFRGLPTPANGIFFATLLSAFVLSVEYGDNTPLNYVIMLSGHPYILVGLVIAFSLLMVSDIPLFALKFKNFRFSDNKIRFIFLGLCAMLITAGILIGNVFISIPIIILLYLVISIINNLFSNEIQSGN